MNTKTKTPVLMKKSLAPKQIPNGSKGVVFADPESPGLHLAKFGKWSAYVYWHEVELVEQ